MDIHVLWILVFNYPCFYGYSFGYTLDFYGYPCIDLLWILEGWDLLKTDMKRLKNVTIMWWIVSFYY